MANRMTHKCVRYMLMIPILLTLAIPVSAQNSNGAGVRLERISTSTDSSATLTNGSGARTVIASTDYSSVDTSNLLTAGAFIGLFDALSTIPPVLLTSGELAGYLIDLIQLSAQQLEVADVNGDGEIDIADVIELVNRGL